MYFSFAQILKMQKKDIEISVIDERTHKDEF
jgi:hypothetical protein